MNKTLLSVLFSTAAILGLYFWWESGKQPELKSWDLVPQDALLVYEYQENSSRDPTDILIKPFLTDSVRKSLLRSHQMLVSAHILGKESGIVLYLTDDSGIEKNILSALKYSGTFRERVFDGFRIMEGVLKGDRTIATTKTNGLIVISSVSLLIEDVIRIAKSKERQNFIRRQESLLAQSSTKADSGNVFVDLSQSGRFFNSFLSANHQRNTSYPFGQSAVIERKWEKNDLLLSGFAIDSLAGEKSLLSLFNSQKPVPVKLQRIVSNRSGLLEHFGISDFQRWREDRLEFCKTKAPWVADSLSSLTNNKKFDASGFCDLLSGEMGSCMAGIFSGEIFILGLKNGDTKVASILAKLENKRNPEHENYSQYSIRMLQETNLLRTLFWPLTSKKMSHYAFAGGYLIFSENMKDMKAFIDDIDNDNTWGKLTAWNDFLSTSQDTNLGIIVDGLNWWPSVRNTFTDSWKSFGDSSRLLDVDKASFQFGRLEQRYYFSGVVKFNRQHKAIQSKGKENIPEASLIQPVSGNISIVKNHNSGDTELLVQDESMNLNLYSTGLKSLFSVQLDGKIKTDISQIDFLKNRKLQYLFATDKSLWLIDRLGRNVEGFPRKLAGEHPVQSMTVLDYDHNKNYRFLVSDIQGNLELYERNGNPARDWKKIELKNSLWVAPRSVRVLGKDFLIAVTVNGDVHAFDRMGKLMKGFPVSLKERPMGSWFFDGEKGTMLFVSGDGLITEIDLKGNESNKTHLPKSSAGSRFSLVPTQDMEHYVFSRTDRGKAAVIDSKGETIFEIENPGSEEIFLTFFDLQRDRSVFVLSDPQQEFHYLFDGHGKPVFTRPLESQLSPVVTTDKGGIVQFYCVRKNKILDYSSPQEKR